MQWDELLLGTSALVVVWAIAKKVIRYGGWRAAWTRFRADGIEGDELILVALLLPELLQVVYYFLLFVPFANLKSNHELRAIIIRPSIITSNFILAIYFLNGRLTCALRRGLDTFELWKRRWRSSPSS